MFEHILWKTQIKLFFDINEEDRKLEEPTVCVAEATMRLRELVQRTELDLRVGLLSGSLRTIRSPYGGRSLQSR